MGRSILTTTRLNPWIAVIIAVAYPGFPSNCYSDPLLHGRNPGRRWWWWNDRWTVVASNRIGQFPRSQPGSGSTAAIVAAEIDQRELRPGRSEVERTAVIDANGAYVAGVYVLEGCRTGHPCADH